MLMVATTTLEADAVITYSSTRPAVHHARGPNSAM
jgi:hypothetical protein